MTDLTATQTTPPAPNTAEAREPDGTLKAPGAPSEPKKEATPPATAPEAKDDKSLLNKDAKDGAKPPDGAPEKYEDFKVPEGFKLDEAVATEANTLFKELNLPQAAAQKLIDFYTAKTQAAAEAPYKAYADMRTEWQNAVKADPEIGGKLDEVKTTIGRMYDSWGDPKLAADFKEFMDFTGAGDNIAFIKPLYKMAQRLSEGRHVSGRGPTAPSQGSAARQPSAAQALYPNLPSSA